MGMRIGIFIDASNLGQNGGSGMRYDVLGKLAARNGDIAQRLNVYLSYDPERAQNDYTYRTNSKFYHQRLRSFGFKVIIKEVQTYTSADGTKNSKSNADMELAVDLLLQSDKLDRVILGTGDGDFVRVVSALQDKGLRVDVLAFRNCSRKLVEAADCFLNGYLIPELIPNPYYNQNENAGPNYKHSDTECEMTGVVQMTNIESRKSVIRYLEQAPGSFLETDQAWKEIEVDITQNDIDKHTMMRGNVVTWLGDPVTKLPISKNKFIRLGY